MSFRNKTTDELIRVAKAGLSFTLVTDSRPAEDIDQIANAAAESGAKVRFVMQSALEAMQFHSTHDRTQPG